MRTFILMAVLAVAAFWGARSLTGEEPQWRLVRVALYMASGLFAGLLLSALLQALLSGD